MRQLQHLPYSSLQGIKIQFSNLMETKADLTPLYAILQAKETDSDRSQSNDAFDQGKKNRTGSIFVT